MEKSSYFCKSNIRLTFMAFRKTGNNIAILCMLAMMLIMASCANMGSPQGGLYDEDPPRILYAIPAEKGTNATSNKIQIFFDEYVKIENASEKVIVSPPQLETPEIKDQGKKIVVELLDTLKPNMTYTVDFSDAIVDFTEGNPLGNYTYSFSTGDVIDTLEVSGNVLDASNLEPIKGILVGLYNETDDSVFTTKPMLRVARTDGRGHFVIRGIAPGNYRAFALQDMDNDFKFSQKAEMIAFNHDVFSPSFGPATRQDTTWIDSLHIESVKLVPYTRFMPDDIVLLAFNEVQTDRHLIKTERVDPEKLSLYFTYGHENEPIIRGLNFDDRDAFVVEANVKKDTISYWLTDSALINNDSLEVELQYMETDTTGVLVNKTDTILFAPKFSYEKRTKLEKEEYQRWLKVQKKKLEKDQVLDSIMPPKPLEPTYHRKSTLTPEDIYEITMPTPLAKLDTAGIHLYAKVDTSWYRAPFIFRPKENTLRSYEIIAEWRDGSEYSLEIDTATFVDIYGKVSAPYKGGIKISNSDECSTLLVTVSGTKCDSVYVELLDQSDKPIKTIMVIDGNAEFFYLKPGEYYMRAFEDANGNGIWDTGLYADNIQPERVYYYNKSIECKEKWDVNMSWDVSSVPTAKQKPQKITKQKADKEKTIKNRNKEYIQKYLTKKTKK